MKLWKSQFGRGVRMDNFSRSGSEEGRKEGDDEHSRHDRFHCLPLALGIDRMVTITLCMSWER